MDWGGVLFQLKYPKFYLLLVFIIAATIFYWNAAVLAWIGSLGAWNYFVSFIGGMLFAFGLSAPFAAGYFLTASPQNIFVAALLGGLGAMIVDLLIFRFIKSALHVRLGKVKAHRYLGKIDKVLSHRVGKLFVPYASFAVAGMIIAAPLPDNLGTVLVSGITRLRERELAILSFITYTVVVLFTIHFKYLLAFACGVVACPW